jgi:hypothetical protein
VDHYERKDAFAVVSFVALANVIVLVCCSSIGRCTTQVSIPFGKEAWENWTHKTETQKKYFFLQWNLHIEDGDMYSDQSCDYVQWFCFRHMCNSFHNFSFLAKQLALVIHICNLRYIYIFVLLAQSGGCSAHYSDLKDT